MKSYMNCPHCGQEIEILTFSDNTRPASPRFTAEEREAMKNIMDNAVVGANATYQLNKKYIGNDKAKEILQVASDDLIAIRKILEGAE